MKIKYRVAKWDKIFKKYRQFAWTTWRNEFDSQLDAQTKADELNLEKGIDPESAEDFYAVELIS